MTASAIALNRAIAASPSASAPATGRLALAVHPFDYGLASLGEDVIYDVYGLLSEVVHRLAGFPVGSEPRSGAVEWVLGAAQVDEHLVKTESLAEYVARPHEGGDYVIHPGALCRIHELALPRGAFDQGAVPRPPQPGVDRQDSVLQGLVEIRETQLPVKEGPDSRCPCSSLSV